MIGKITTGSNFKPLMYYLLKEDKVPKIIGGNMLPSDPWSLARSFQATASFRPTTTKPVKHYSIGFAPEDGEISDEVKAEVGAEIVKRMGFMGQCPYEEKEQIINNQYLVVAHGRHDPAHEYDHNHDHIHIVVNLVNFDGDRVNDGWDKRRLEKVLREVEQEYKLTPVVSSLEYQKKRSVRKDADSDPQVKDTANLLKTTMAKQYAESSSYSQFIQRIKKLGVDIKKIRPQRARGKNTYRYSIPFADITLEKTETKDTPLISNSTRLYTVDTQKEQLLSETKRAIAKAVSKHTQDSPDFFVFVQRMKNDGIEVISYRTAGKKRSGRYKLKYRYKGGIDLRAGKHLGGSLSELVECGKIKFDPEVHYRQPIPEKVSFTVETEQAASKKPIASTTTNQKKPPSTPKIKNLPKKQQQNQNWEL